MTAPEPGTTDGDVRERLVVALTDALGWEWNAEPCVPSVRSCIEPIADALIEAFPVLAALPAPAARTGNTEREVLAQVRLCRSYVAHEDSGRHNQPIDEYTVPVVVDPDLPTLGRNDKNHQFDLSTRPVITLREPDEQVLLHEVLHLLFDGWLRPEAGEHGHKAIALAEVALWLAGYRRAAPDDTEDGEGR